MPEPSRVRSASAGVLTAGLAALLLDVALRSAYVGYAAGGAVGFIAATLSAVGLLRGNSFEARLTAVVVSGMSGLLALLGMVVGAPGASDGRLTIRGLLFVCAGIAIPFLVARDARARGARLPLSRPYAR